MNDQIIYLDNNAWQPITQTEIIQFQKNVNTCNPNSLSKLGQNCREVIIDGFKQNLIDILNFDRDNDKFNIDNSDVIIEQSGSDANVDAILGRVLFLLKQDNAKDINLLTTDIEHSSIQHLTFDILPILGVNVITMKPDQYGQISIDVFKKTLNENKQKDIIFDIISICQASGETGVINNIYELAKYYKEQSNKDGYFHSDCIQSFYKIDIPYDCIDSVSIAFQKIGGPTGVSSLVKKKGTQLLFTTKDQISNMRGGTINFGLIAACKVHLQQMKQDIIVNRQKIHDYSDQFIQQLQEQFNVIFYNDVVKCINDNDEQSYLKLFKDNAINIIIFGMHGTEQQLENTILIASIYVHKTNVIPYCRLKMREILEENNIIIGLGSACNTTNQNKALQSQNIPKILTRSVVRISTSHTNDIEKIKYIYKQMSKFYKDPQNLIEDYVDNKWNINIE